MGLWGDVCSGFTKVASDFVGDMVGDAVSSVAGTTVGNFVEGLVSDGIDSLVGDLDLLSMGGNIAESLCDALLPEDLEVVGDLVAGAVNITTGNWPAAISDGLDALEAFNKIGSYFASSGSDAAPVPPPSDTAVSCTGGPETPTETSKTDASQSTSTTNTDSASGTNAASDSKAASSGDTKVDKEKAGEAAAKAFLDANKNPEDLMAAIRNGDIPTDVLNSQGGMMMLQQQMNQIQMMNTMMTNMMKSMHDMSMAIASNMRV